MESRKFNRSSEPRPQGLARARDDSPKFVLGGLVLSIIFYAVVSTSAAGWSEVNLSYVNSPIAPDQPALITISRKGKEDCQAWPNPSGLYHLHCGEVYVEKIMAGKLFQVANGL